jgi:hypothetical protein
MTAAGVELVPLRRLYVAGVEAAFELHPGDRALVTAEERVAAGTDLAAHLRDARTAIVPGPARGHEQAVPGRHWSPAPGRRSHEGEAEPHGELLFRSGDRWRLGTGEHDEPVEAPVGGVVTAVRPGIEIRLRTEARGVLGVQTLGSPTSGLLSVATGPDGELRAPHIDVSASGAILVAGARIDAEALTRARAVGVRGIIVAALGVKERRDFQASERRGRAAVHGLPPFGILVLDGAAGRPIASPVMAALQAMEGRPVALLPDPACVVLEDAEVELPQPPEGLVRVRSGPFVGAEGEWAGLAGPRRFSGGVVMEAGLVRFGDRPPVAVPLGDLERFA